MRRGALFRGRLVTRQDEATGARACELGKARCDELLAMPVRIEQGAHLLNHGVRLDRSVAVSAELLARRQSVLEHTKGIPAVACLLNYETSTKRNTIKREGRPDVEPHPAHL
jgi:hypothetical protein